LGFWKVLVTWSAAYLETQLDLAEKAEFSKHGCQYSLRFSAVLKYVCMSKLEVLQLNIFFWKSKTWSLTFVTYRFCCNLGGGVALN